MVIEDLIHPDDKASIMRALLLRHRHVNDHQHGSFHFGPKRKYSSYSSLQVSSCHSSIFYNHYWFKKKYITYTRKKQELVNGENIDLLLARVNFEREKQQRTTQTHVIY